MQRQVSFTSSPKLLDLLVTHLVPAVGAGAVDSRLNVDACADVVTVDALVLAIAVDAVVVSRLGILVALLHARSVRAVVRLKEANLLCKSRADGQKGNQGSRAHDEVGLYGTNLLLYLVKPRGSRQQWRGENTGSFNHRVRATVEYMHEEGAGRSEWRFACQDKIARVPLRLTFSLMPFARTRTNYLENRLAYPPAKTFKAVSVGPPFHSRMI